VETCRRSPSKDLAKALDRVFATPGFTEDAPDVPGGAGTSGRLAAKLRNLPFPASFRSFTPYEAEATALHVFEHSLVPGLLQTQACARAVLATRSNTPMTRSTPWSPDGWHGRPSCGAMTCRRRCCGR
jgi:Domain of unknown function (DUF5753)